VSWENTGAGHWHYTTFWLRDDDSGMTALRDMFPDAEADEMNFVLFSTSGVHGSYCTIEEVESDPDRSTVTFLVVHPRLVTLRYGNCVPQTEDDFSFLKKLRANSHKAVLKIGL
jgi:hypothetical protein